MNIKLNLPAEPFSGQIVTFTAPCDCASVTDGLSINGEIYTVCDAVGKCVTGEGGAWIEGAQVSVVLDCTAKKAYVQNNGVTPKHIGAADIPHTAKGSVIAIGDSGNASLMGLKLYGQTTQNGTPTPSSPVPLESAGASGIIGVTVAGKNIFDEIGWYERHGFTKQSDGSWLGVAIVEKCFTNTARQKGAMYITATVKSTVISGVPMYIIVYYTDGTRYNAVSAHNRDGFITTTAKTDPEKTIDYIKWSFGGDGVYYVKDIMFSFIDNEYEPYKGTQTITASTPNGLPGIPVSNDGNYTDADGQQWICDEIDFARGVRITRIAEVDMGSLDWTYHSEYGVFSSILTQTPTSHADGLCTHYPVVAKAYDVLADKEVVIRDKKFSSTIRIIVKDSSYTDVAAFKAPMAGAKVVYELETPIETPLTSEELAAFAALHSYKPNTTVFNDGGADMDVTYCTPNTAVPTNLGSGKEGNLLSVDDHGCVVAVPKASMPFAPAGYGLGLWTGKMDVTDADQMLCNGWYYCNDVVNTPFKYGWLHVSARDSNWIKQEFCSAMHNGAPTLIRTKATGVWGEWEWVNPPMVIGVEYRTTERWREKAVYTIAVSVGNLPNTSKKTLEGVVMDGCTEIFYARTRKVFANLSILPSSDGTYGWIDLVSTSDLSNETEVVTLKYTKE